MANTPIYENPNGRKRRKGYSTEIRNKILEAKEYYNINSPDFKFNTVEHMMLRTTLHTEGVDSPWKNINPNVKLSSHNLPDGRVEASSKIPFDRTEIESYIEETAKALQQEMGLGDVNIKTMYGVYKGDDPRFVDKGIKKLHGSYYSGDNHIELEMDNLWDTVIQNNKNNRIIPKKEINLIDDYKQQIRDTLSHEMRHQWQHTTEEGKSILDDTEKYKRGETVEDYKKKYKNKTKKYWDDDFKSYWGEPIEVDARRTGKKYRSKKQYNKTIKNYRQKLEQEALANEATRKKIEEINMRPKNRIIGHQFEKEPINISSYRKFDNVEPIDWDIDTGNKSPINKYDVSRNTRYKNAKLNKGQKSLRPTVTMDGNNVEIDSIYNHSVPKKINKAPEPETYNPKIGDNIINSDTGERYVLSQIDKANPDLDIHKDTYYYNSPNGERITRTSPIDPNKNSNYKLDYDDMLSPDDVRRINNSFNDLAINTNLLNEAKSKLSSLKDQFDNGADNLNEIYQTEKAVRNLESKVANVRMQIDEDNLKYNSKGKYAYNINEKTRKYMEQADNLLGDYSETKYVNDYEEIFKEAKPRQFINSIDPGVDDAFNLINEASVENNIKARTRTRGKKKNAQLTGRGNKKRRIQSTGRGNKNTIKTKPKKAPTLKRRGKSSKFRAVGRNGKVLNNIPRKAIPLNKKDIIKTAANLIVNEAATNTANTIIKNINDINTPNVNNAPHPDSSDIPSVDNPIPEPDHSNTPEPEFEIPSGYSDDPSTWTDEDIADMADGDSELYEELKKRREEAFNNNTPETHTNTPEPENNSGPQGEPIPPKPFSKNFDPNDPDTWTRDDIERMNNPSTWTDDDIKLLADGDEDYAKELMNRRSGGNGPSNKLPDEFDFNDAPIPERNKIDTPDTKIFDEDGLPQGLSKMDIAMTGLNILGAVGDYKSARREGHGVVSSAVRAGAKFAIDEALGWWALPIGIVKTLPGAAIKGADMLYKENRRMNSAANFQVFGDAQFMDTQQLATMRQSGMEMAKMAQYNLQQTLMGSEAKYLHR